MIGLPLHICELSPRRLNAFKSFLANSGAEIFSTRDNPYEVVRFRTGDGIAVIHQNRKGHLKFTGPVGVPWRAFVSNAQYRATPRPGEIGRERDEVVAALVARDGHECFYCPNFIPIGYETIEHLVPATAGGPGHLANLALAHRSCNEAAGALSLFEKIRLRERRRGVASRDRRNGDVIAHGLIEDLAELADQHRPDERDTRFVGTDLALCRRARVARELYDAARIGEIVDQVIAEMTNPSAGG